MSDPTDDAIARNVARFNEKFDRDLQRELGLPPRAEKKPNKGISLNKDAITRSIYTGQMYDSPARRQAITAYLERIGVSKELQAIRNLMELGQGAPARDIEKERRDAASRGAHLREKDARGREGIERERD